jgi:hypothetical protein
MIGSSAAPRPLGRGARPRLAAVLAVVVLSSGCTESAIKSLAPPVEARPIVPIGRSFSHADSSAAGFFSRAAARLAPGVPSLGLIGGSPTASVASVSPAWYQGAAQPQTVRVNVNGLVNSVTVSGSGAMLCTGTFGAVIAYDKSGVVLGSSPMTLIDPADCGGDNITYGATATITVTQGVIARFDITPVTPLNFYGGAGRASATYYVSLGTYTAADYPPLPAFANSCNASTFDCTLNASGSSDDFGITSFAWNLGKSPGGTAAGSLVTTNYFHASWRTVTLSVTDTKAQTSTLTRTFGIGVGLPPGSSPGGNIVATCNGLTCTFVDNANASSPDMYRTWDFDDGVYLNNVPSPTRTFAAGGPVSVWEKIADHDGVYGFASGVAYPVGPPADAWPQASFTYTCAGQALPHQCAFTSTSTDDVGIVSYRWDWGNGRSETRVGTTARNTWASAGTYQVTLTVTDTKGQISAIAIPVLVP